MVELTREYMDWVYGIRRHYYPTAPYTFVDDLIGAGMLGLAQAAKTYDPDRGASFRSHAHRRIHGAMQDHLRSTGTSRRKEMTQQRPAMLVGDWTLVESIAGGVAPTNDCEQTIALDQAIEALNKRERFVIRMVYLSDHKQCDVAAMMDISPNRVNQIVRVALAKLRVLLGTEALAV